MDRIARYLTHPQVLIDPHKNVRLWGLHEIGRSRVAAPAKSSALTGTTRVVSSSEIKALDTARPLAEALGCEVEVRERMHENDRSATGFLPPAEFENVADQFFTHPEVSIRGWEKAVDAQSRICREVEACLKSETSGDTLFVGHGAVGTLLFCALSGIPISRDHDQGPGGGGCYFAFPITGRKPLCGWQQMETMIEVP